MPQHRVSSFAQPPSSFICRCAVCTVASKPQLQISAPVGKRPASSTVLTAKQPNDGCKDSWLYLQTLNSYPSLLNFWCNAISIATSVTILIDKQTASDLDNQPYDLPSSRSAGSTKNVLCTAQILRLDSGLCDETATNGYTPRRLQSCCEWRLRQLPVFSDSSTQCRGSVV